MSFFGAPFGFHSLLFFFQLSPAKFWFLYLLISFGFVWVFVRSRYSVERFFLLFFLGQFWLGAAFCVRDGNFGDFDDVYLTIQCSFATGLILSFLIIGRFCPKKETRRFEPSLLVSTPGVFYEFWIITSFVISMFFVSSVVFSDMPFYLHKRDLANQISVYTQILQHFIYRVCLPVFGIILLLSNDRHKILKFGLFSLFAVTLGFSYLERQAILLVVFVFFSFTIFNFINTTKKILLTSAIMIPAILFLFSVTTEIQHSRSFSVDLFFGAFDKIYSRVILDPVFMGYVAMETGQNVSQFNGRLNGVPFLNAADLYRGDVHLSSYGFMAGLWLNFRTVGVLIGAIIFGSAFRYAAQAVQQVFEKTPALFFVQSLIFLNFAYFVYSELLPTTAIFGLALSLLLCLVVFRKAFSPVHLIR